MALTSDTEKVVIHRIRITPRQLARRSNPQLAQIPGYGRADVRNVLQAGNISNGAGSFAGP